jgi:hypothetical protein
MKVFSESPSILNEKFLYHLRNIANIPSRFWVDTEIKKAMKYCRGVMNNLPNSWKTTYDASGNLIVCNLNCNKQLPILYLCAHIDTVGADESQWLSSPFQISENETHLTARGVNDCKAGVALILAISELITMNTKLNIGFIITYREEGNRGKTSSNLQFNDLIVSDSKTYIICLENTLKINIQNNSFQLGIYDREPHNLFITVSGTIKELRDYLQSILITGGWKPVVISSSPSSTKGKVIDVISNPFPGHISTLNNNDNILLKTITENKNNYVELEFGNKNETSVVGSVLNIYSVNTEVKHDLILNYRGFETFDHIKENLESVPYEETFSFLNGLGSNQSSIENRAMLTEYFKIGNQNNSHEIIFQDNPGRSDASAIYNALPNHLKDKVIPFACGPGCRSHTDHKSIYRATHGPNEGFYKPSTEFSLPIFTGLIENFLY